MTGEMRANKSKILAATLALLMLICIASPQDELSPDEGGKLIDKIIKALYSFADWFKDAMVTVILSILGWLKDFIMKNPDTNDVKPLVDDFIEILMPIYVMIIVILGIYMIFASIAPAERAKAKSMFWKILLSMVLVTMSFEIFQMLLSLSEALSLRMMANVVTTDLPQFGGLRLMNTFSVLGLVIFLGIILILAAISVALRYILVLVACALFPFTLFLYFFEFTKGTGTKFLRFSIGAIFTQVIQALILSVTVSSMNSVNLEGATFNTTVAHAFMVCGGGILIHLAPLLMVGLMQWLGGLMAGVGVAVSFVHPALGGAMVGLGSIGAGMGPGGMIAGGTAYGLGKSYKQSVGIESRGERRRREKREEKSRQKEEEKRRRGGFSRSTEPPGHQKTWGDYT